MIVHGYELVNGWKNSQCGQIAIAIRSGKKYFLKKYQTPVAPMDNGALDAKTFAHNKQLFEKFVSTRKKINEELRIISGLGGNIVVPCEEFAEGNNYVEASEYVENTIAKEELEGVLSSLSLDVKKLLMLTAAGALSSVHSKHIVHSDLKLQNVLLAINSSSNYIAKLIDFDSSYFVNEKPDEIVGTIDYYSPELGLYADSEDDRETLGKNLSEKSDIFSLGLIYHFYLSGALPTPATLTDRLRRRQEKGKPIYCWIVLNSGCELQLNPSISNVKYLSLISDMLSANPNDRPTSIQVLQRLKETDPVIEEPWTEHSIVLDKEKLRNAGIAGLKKINIESCKKYEILYSNGKKNILTKEELLSKGLTKKNIPTTFSEPLHEHQIEFDIDKIKSRGFISCIQKNKDGISGYDFYRNDSTSNFFKCDMLIAMGYAYKKITNRASSNVEPWPEHNFEFDKDMISKKGYVSYGRMIQCGINGYNFVRSDGTNQFLRAEMVLVQKMAKKL